MQIFYFCLFVSSLSFNEAKVGTAVIAPPTVPIGTATSLIVRTRGIAGAIETTGVAVCIGAIMFAAATWPGSAGVSAPLFDPEVVCPPAPLLPPPAVLDDDEAALAAAAAFDAEVRIALAAASIIGLVSTAASAAAIVMAAWFG